MYKLSNIISMPVMSIYESKIIGLVNNVLFDSKTNKCKQLIITNNDDIKYILDYKNINNVGDNSIVISNTSKISLYESAETISQVYYNPINAEIYDTKGTKIDKVKDIALNENLKIINFLTQKDNTIHIDKILSFTDSVVLYRDKKVSLNNYKPKKSIIIKNTNSIIKALDKTPESKIEESEIKSTNKLPDLRTLLGRITLKNISTQNGEIIIKKNQIVTKEIITIASKFGKIVELMRYSRE